MKHSAPALAHGLMALRLLNTRGSMTLERLTGESGIPKSSLLRFMDTLTALGLVRRDPTTKRYQSLAAVVPVNDVRQPSLEILRDALIELSESTGRTVEWYAPHAGRWVITERREARDGDVRVSARIGFERSLDDEFEAVAQVALAFWEIQTDELPHWAWRSGEKQPLAATELDEIKRRTVSTGVAMDSDYNPQGVRRHAVPVRSRNGELIGVLALAENFTPTVDREIPHVQAALRETAAKLESSVVAKSKSKT